MVTIEIRSTGFREAAKKMLGRATALDREMKTAVNAAALAVWSDARDRKNWAGILDNPKPRASQFDQKKLKRLSIKKASRLGRPLPPPGPLRVLTGMLLRSYARRVEKRGNTYVGIVGSRLKYARPHELGGTWMARGRLIKMPKRPVLGPALDRQRTKVLRMLGDAVRRGLRG